MSNKLYCHDAVTCIVIGQQFTWHYDAIQPHLKDSSGNRIATLIVYLNDCKSGGETAFRDLDLKVRVGIFDAFLILSAIPSSSTCYQMCTRRSPDRIHFILNHFSTCHASSLCLLSTLSD